MNSNIPEVNKKIVIESLLLLNIFNQMKYILVTTKNTEIHEEEPCLIGVEFSPA